MSTSEYANQQFDELNPTHKELRLMFGMLIERNPDDVIHVINKVYKVRARNAVKAYTDGLTG